MRPNRPRHDAVIDAAARVFARRGYEATSVQDVADELGMNKASLYYYVDSKEELLFRLCQKLHDDMDTMLLDVDSNEDGTSLLRLTEYVRWHVEYNLTRRRYVAVYYHDIESLTGQRLKTVRSRQRRHRDFLEALIAAAQADGYLDRTLHVGVVSSCILALSTTTYRWYQPGGGLSRSELAAAVTSFALQGLGLSGEHEPTSDH